MDYPGKEKRRKLGIKYLERKEFQNEVIYKINSHRWWKSWKGVQEENNEPPVELKSKITN